MTVPELIAALALPVSCRVDQRVPKRMLIENGAPTAADKRLLSDAIEEIQWVAALKPNTVGVAAYRDEEREYLEVAVLSITTHATAKGDVATAPSNPVNTTRLAELAHRAVPYPLLLILATPGRLFLSMAHKRWAQNEPSKVVVDGEVTTIEVADDLTAEHQFLRALASTRQPATTLMALYQGWLDCLTAFQAAQYTGTYKNIGDPIHAASLREALRECRRLELEGARLRKLASKEKQVAKQVELNLALKRVKAGLLAARHQLDGTT